MHKAELIRLLVEDLTEKHLALTENAVKESVDALLQCIVDVISAGGGMEVRGFGSFSLKYFPARKARNPKNGKELYMSARHRLHFKSGKKLKLRLNARYK